MSPCDARKGGIPLRQRGAYAHRPRKASKGRGGRGRRRTCDYHGRTALPLQSRLTLSSKLRKVAYFRPLDVSTITESVRLLRPKRERYQCVLRSLLLVGQRRRVLPYRSSVGCYLYPCIGFFAAGGGLRPPSAAASLLQSVQIICLKTQHFGPMKKRNFV